VVVKALKRLVGEAVDALAKPEFPNSEFRKKSEARILTGRDTRPVRTSDFGLHSDFGFRISGFA
jgi:hypothetical protein